MSEQAQPAKNKKKQNETLIWKNVSLFDVVFSLYIPGVIKQNIYFKA